MFHRPFVLSSFILAPLFLVGCSGGGSGTTSVEGSATFSSGAYEMTLDRALVVCADGSSFPKGYGVSVTIDVDKPLLTIKGDDSQQIGAGSVNDEGVFHAQVSLTTETGETVITLDGKVDGSQIAGGAQGMYIPTTGSRCALNTYFIVSPKEGA